MTNWGEKIPAITLAELQAKLAATNDDGKAVKRLVAAISYKRGHSPEQIEQAFGFPEQSVYHWLDRLENRDLEDALYDGPRSGRPSKLSDEQFRELAAALARSPAEAGYEDRTWSPRLVQGWLDAQFDVEYSRRHVRRLMAEASGASPAGPG